MLNNKPTIIHFVRHSIVDNPKEIFYGRLPRFGLSQEGIDLIESQAQLLRKRKIDQVFSSPQLRARQTAKLFMHHLGINQDILISKWLAEVNTPYEGQKLKDLDSRNWDLYSGNQFPFEQPGDLHRRMILFTQRLLRRHPGTESLAVTHADNIVFLKLWANGYPVDYVSKRKIELLKINLDFPAPASITTFIWDNPKDIKQVAFEKNE